MPYLGNVPATNFSTVAYQDLTGGSGTSFTLNHPAGTAQDIEVFVNNVRQEPGVAYTVAGTALTMTGSIASTDDFYVVFQGKAQQTVTPGANTLTTAMLQDGSVTSAKLNSNAAFTKNANDPAYNTNGTLGDVWLNTTSGEMFALTDATTNNNVWTNIGDGTGNVIPQYSVQYLVVAGGGGGAHRGGGGAGGVLTDTRSTGISPGDVLTVTVGAGGAAASGQNVNGTNGDDSSVSSTGGGFSTVTATGGGAGGFGNGVAGGSGGGADYQATGGAGTSGQGNNGGDGKSSATVTGGGGGGKGAVGGTGGGTGGVGGAGEANTITGSSVTYAGGGGGGSETVAGGAGGSGGGGTGATSPGTSQPATAGTDGLGGGGGGGYSYSNASIAKDGGNGIVILRVPTARYTGTTTGSPTVTTTGTDTVMSFTSSGSYTG